MMKRLLPLLFLAIYLFIVPGWAREQVSIVIELSEINGSVFEFLIMTAGAIAYVTFTPTHWL